MRLPAFHSLLLCTALALPGVAVAGDSVALSSSGVGTLHVDGLLGAVGRTEFLLDTGSAYVVLSAATRNKLAAGGKLRQVRKLRAVMANNHTVAAPVYRVSRLELSANCVITDFEAVALPGARKNILGLSALRAVAPFTVHLEPARLELTCADAAVAGGLAGPQALAAR
jgi:predicted aspartyl protease